MNKANQTVTDANKAGNEVNPMTNDHSIHAARGTHGHRRQGMRAMAAVAVLLLFGTFSSFPAVPILDVASYPGTGHLYYLLDNSNWTDAENQAGLLGGHLMTVNDQAENDWVANLWGGTRSLWIGYNDVAIEGQFEWVSGETPGFENWNGGEPNNSPGHDFAYLLSGVLPPSVAGTWNDINDTAVYPNQNQPDFYGVVEVIPEPTSFALLGLGSLVWAVARRRR